MTLPIELYVRGHEVALVGDHPETRAKVPRLLAAGARVVLFDADAPVEAVPEGVELRAGMPSAEALRRFLVVFASPALEARLGEVAARVRAEGRLFCVLDRPELSTFANPAIVQAGGIALRLFGGGAAPGLTRRLRQELAAALGSPRFTRFVEALAARRRGWPREERAARTREALDGFALHTQLRLPSWFEGPETPPRGGAEGGKVPEDGDNT